MEAITSSALRLVRSVYVGGSLLVAAGAAAIVGAVLRWGAMTYPAFLTQKTHFTVGHHELGFYLGGFMVVGGLVVIAIRSRQARWAWSTVSGLCGLVLAGFAVYDLVTLKDRSVTDLINRSVGGHGSSVNRTLVAARVRALDPFSFRFGIYLALAAGALAVAGAAVTAWALRTTRS
jgi:hypothetical protein